MKTVFSTTQKSGHTRIKRRQSRRGIITLADVAQRAGVSTCTVSRVLSGAPEGTPIRPQTRQRVEEAAQDLGYAPNAAARALAAGRTGTIGVVCYSITDPLVPPLLAALEGEAEKRGYQLFISTTHSDPMQEAVQGKSYISLLQEKRVDGILIFGDAIIESAGYLADYPQISSATAVGITGEGLVCAADVDHYAGGIDVGKYLAALGHKNVAFLTGGTSSKSVKRRQDGVRAGLQECGGNLVCIGEGFSLPFEAAGVQGVKTVLREHPEITAIICRNDMLALGAMRGLRMGGVEIPAQMSLLSWGDAYFNALAYPSVTAIKSPLIRLGSALLEKLLQAIRKAPISPTYDIMSMDLRARESTGPARGGSL